MRLWHELPYHQSSIFLTLTYDDDNLPPNASLSKSDLQKFFKRLRKDLSYVDRKIKYFAAGEYGPKTNRPHYHAIVFGLSLQGDDKKLVIKAWPFCDWHNSRIFTRSFGAVSADSIRYVAQYIDDKLSGQLADEVYTATGREPVFKISSQGLGLQYCLDNADQLYDNQSTSMLGVKCSLPRYYLTKLDIPRDILHRRSVDADVDYVYTATGLRMTSDDYYKFVGPELAHKAQEENKQRSDTIHARLLLRSKHKL